MIRWVGVVGSEGTKIHDSSAANWPAEHAQELRPAPPVPRWIGVWWADAASARTGSHTAGTVNYQASATGESLQSNLWMASP